MLLVLSARAQAVGCRGFSLPRHGFDSRPVPRLTFGVQVFLGQFILLILQFSVIVVQTVFQIRSFTVENL